MVMVMVRARVRVMVTVTLTVQLKNEVPWLVVSSLPNKRRICMTMQGCH